METPKTDPNTYGTLFFGNTGISNKSQNHRPTKKSLAGKPRPYILVPQRFQTKLSTI